MSAADIERLSDVVKQALPYVSQSGFEPRVVVRALLTALREPSEEIIAAGECCLFEHMPEARDWTLRATKDAWQAMIDSYLGET